MGCLETSDIAQARTRIGRVRIMADDRKKRFKEHHRAHAEAAAEWRAHGYSYPAPAFPVLDHDLRSLPCGATTRRGKSCRRTDIYTNGRCKFHGGLSTGPKTEVGKTASRANLALRWAHRKPMEG